MAGEGLKTREIQRSDSGPSERASRRPLTPQLLHFNVTGPVSGCFISPPVLLRFQMRCLQSEIPFGGTVGVVDQHQVRIVLQPFGLLFHGLAVLLHEFRKHKLQATAGPNGTQRKRFHAATTSMRQWLRVIGVTVVRLTRTSICRREWFPAAGWAEQNRWSW